MPESGSIEGSHIQPFSQNSLTATVPKVFQIGLCGVVVADLELFCNSWSVGFLGERLYSLPVARDGMRATVMDHTERLQQSVARDAVVLRQERCSARLLGGKGLRRPQLPHLPKSSCALVPAKEAWTRHLGRWAPRRHHLPSVFGSQSVPPMPWPVVPAHGQGCRKVGWWWSKCSFFLPLSYSLGSHPRLIYPQCLRGGVLRPRPGATVAHRYRAPPKRPHTKLSRLPHPGRPPGHVSRCSLPSAPRSHGAAGVAHQQRHWDACPGRPPRARAHRLKLAVPAPEPTSSRATVPVGGVLAARRVLPPSNSIPNLRPMSSPADRPKSRATTESPVSNKGGRRIGPPTLA